jgi:hypothetical protein
MRQTFNISLPKRLFSFFFFSWLFSKFLSKYDYSHEKYLSRILLHLGRIKKFNLVTELQKVFILIPAVHFRQVNFKISSLFLVLRQSKYHQSQTIVNMWQCVCAQVAVEENKLYKGHFWFYLLSTGTISFKSRGLKHAARQMCLCGPRHH